MKKNYRLIRWGLSGGSAVAPESNDILCYRTSLSSQPHNIVRIHQSVSKQKVITLRKEENENTFSYEIDLNLAYSSWPAVSISVMS